VSCKTPGRFTVQASADGKTADIELYGEIVTDWITGMSEYGVNSKTITDELAKIGSPSLIRLRINSPGGDAFTAMAIYNRLKESKARVEVVIDGLAASAASIVAMCGDQITASQNSLVMIHNGWTFAMGNAADLMEAAATLEKVDGQMADVYVARTGQDVAAVKAKLDAETWFTAEEAQAFGLVDSVTPNKTRVAAVASRKFDNAPEWAKTVMASWVDDERKEAPVASEAESKVDEAESKVDVEAVKAEAAKTAAAAERERVSKITATCLLAKAPELAQGLIDGAATIEEAQAAVIKAMATTNKPVGDNGQQNQKPDPDADARKEFDANPAYAKAGMSFDDYRAAIAFEANGLAFRTK